MNANTIDRTPSRMHANETDGLVDAAAMAREVTR